MKVCETITKLEKFLGKNYNTDEITVKELMDIKYKLNAIEKYERTITDLELFLETELCGLIREFCGHDDWSGKKLNRIRFRMKGEYLKGDRPLLIKETLEEFELAYPTPGVYYTYPFEREFDIDTDIIRMRNRKKELEDEIMEIVNTPKAIRQKEEAR